jgi:hypothetical protein
MYNAKIIEKPEDLDEVGHLLSGLSTRFITDLNFLKFWLTNPVNEKPRFFMLTESNSKSSAGIIVGRVYTKKFGIKFGYKNLFKFNTKCLEIFFEGILGDFSSSQMAEILHHLREFIRKNSIDYVILNSLEISLPFYDTVKKTVNPIFRNLLPDLKDRWVLRLPESTEEYYQQRSQNTKSNIRKWRNKMEKAFTGKYEIKCIRKDSDITRALEDVEQINSKAWKGGMGVGFSKTQEIQRDWSYFALNDWLRIYILYINGNPVAHWSGVLYNRKYNLFTTDFDPEYQNYNPGFFLLINMINDFIAGKEVDYYDFGLSGSHYKRLFCDIVYQQSDIFIFSQSINGLRLSFLYNTSVFANQVIKYVLNRLSVLEKVKSAWRKSYTPGENGKNIKKFVLALIGPNT